MAEKKNINLNRYDDGTPSVMRKQTVYTELFFFQKSDVLVQLTKAFCERFLPRYGDRTVDQMVQAARSVKQNIAEGLTDGRTSFEVEIKLLGIAKGSNQELLEDYQDYLKQHHLNDWGRIARSHRGAGNSSGSGNSRDSRNSSGSRNSRNSSNSREAMEAGIASRYDKLLTFCRTHNDLADYEPYFSKWTDEELCNTAITLCHMVDKAMTTYIEGLDREFVEEGGIRERMTAARLDMRGTQKQIIARLEAENALLRARIASLERELEKRK
ncbi:MAG: four helix bundle suffix domain-containing protein [Prevotella sp.]|nr:four helix bundle suffix domain-containing protein [Candidatus Equicola stercoris]